MHRGKFVHGRVLGDAGLLQQRNEFLQFFDAFHRVLHFGVQAGERGLQVAFHAAARGVAVTGLNIRVHDRIVVFFERIDQILVLDQVSVVGKVDRFRFVLVQQPFAQNVVVGLLQAVQRLASAGVAQLGAKGFPVRAQRHGRKHRRRRRAEAAARLLGDHTQGVHVAVGNSKDAK
ncbi:hypothetical protein H310_08202 [Aphanomyces invadans]|uniref:Uncharacterized protein n=1 Tax=Aphanomyces invadans TaxID=157072 RepID=A0A024TZY9_9STRA|nr:hypothetical protein H310_08202 [Aphanomyces invadans]ETV99539.1 hypothetical protein H310_08202 [Aphanomyces invadans]|eukprot:XP_008872095.1 hypothetical protein H310_08202 [Aphanomyces invadans]